MSNSVAAVSIGIAFIRNRVAGMEKKLAIVNMLPPSKQTHGYCSGQFLMHVEITSRVLLPNSTPSSQVIFPPAVQQAQHACKSNMGPKRKPRVLPRAHITLTPLTRNLNSIRAVQYSGDSSHQCKANSGITPASDTKTLRSLPLLRWWQLDGTILPIRGSSHTARLSPRSKRYNAPASMQVMNNYGYMCMTITTIK